MRTEALNDFAAALAEWCNGGSWLDDYTEPQKDAWRKRATALQKNPEVLDIALGGIRELDLGGVT